MENEAVRLLGLMYDKYENGDNCYEDPESCTGYLGKAFGLTAEEEAEILATLKSHPTPAKEKP